MADFSHFISSHSWLPLPFNELHIVNYKYLAVFEGEGGSEYATHAQCSFFLQCMQETENINNCCVRKYNVDKTYIYAAKLSNEAFSFSASFGI